MAAAGAPKEKSPKGRQSGQLRQLPMTKTRTRQTLRRMRTAPKGSRSQLAETMKKPMITPQSARLLETEWGFSTIPALKNSSNCHASLEAGTDCGRPPKGEPKRGIAVPKGATIAPDRRCDHQRREEARVETSKAMSQILRHTGRVREDGYIPVTELLRHPRLRQAGATLTDIQEAVHANDKQRFQLSWQGRGHGRELLIRATQGHSQQQVQDDLLLTRITAPHEVPLAVHGTYFRHYSSIYHQGLRAGGDRGQRARRHVHFAMALPKDQHRATSGMRKDVEILLYLDIPRALRDNMRLYVSTNSVVLTEGFNGCIPIDYIMKVQYMHRQCANDVPGTRPPEGGLCRDWSFLTRLAVIKLPPRLGLYLGAAAAPDKALATGYPLGLFLASSCLIASSAYALSRHGSLTYCSISPSCIAREEGLGSTIGPTAPDELAKRAARAAAKAHGTDGAQPPQSVQVDGPATGAGGVAGCWFMDTGAAKGQATSSTTCRRRRPKPDQLLQKVSSDAGDHSDYHHHRSGHHSGGPRWGADLDNIIDPENGCWSTAEKASQQTVPPPNTAPALDALRLKWDLLLRVHEAAAELQDADVPHLLHLYQAAGGYAARHHGFHLMRDKLMQEGVVGPSGVPLPLPPVGNYILSLGVSILGLQSNGYLPQISSSSTCGDLVEAWSLALWESSRRDLLEQLGELFTLLHSLAHLLYKTVFSVLVPFRREAVQGTVKDMWTSRQVALRYAVDTLRPLTVPAQIRPTTCTFIANYANVVAKPNARSLTNNFSRLGKQTGKPPDQPENLRPIALTEGGCRIVVKALTMSNKSWRRNVLHYENVVTLVLEQELRAARVPEPELAVILNLHHCIGYWPASQDPTTRVASERGVRQGCPLAPSLWTLITIALFRALAGVTSVTWLQEDTTMFADDLLLQWIVHRVQDLENMVDIIAHTFRILAQLGLQVQHRKTQLIVAYKGRQATQWWRAHTATTAEGRFLLIPQPGSKALRLPIVTKLTYLGIILSYVDATTATVDHRLQVAEAQRARLLKVLHSRTLPTTKRVQLWLACVRSSDLYGLHLVDLQQRHVVRITVTLVRHLRAIARSFAHMTQESSRALLERLNVEDPLLSLLQRSQKLLVKTRDSSDPMVARPRIIHWLVHITESKLALTSHLDRTVAEPSVISPSPQDADLQSEEIAAASPTLLPGDYDSNGPDPGGAVHCGAFAAILHYVRTVARIGQERQGSRGSDVPDNRNGPSKMPSGDHALLHRVAKALIVQADYLSRLQSDHTVIFTFRTGNGPQLMVPLLQEVATTWREQRQQNKVTRSLKQTLIQYLAAELVTRINAFAADTESQKKAQELGWTTSEGEFNFLDWDFEDKKLVPRQAETLTHDQILTDAKRLKTLLKNPDLVLKFSGGRNAKPDSTSETATFVLELSMQQPEASEAMAIFRKWYANSALLLLSLRLKPARPERSPLIKEIQEAVGPGHEIQWATYELVAGILHLGPSPQQGVCNFTTRRCGTCKCTGDFGPLGETVGPFGAMYVTALVSRAEFISEFGVSPTPRKGISVDPPLWLLPGLGYVS
ncbi:unnamed protein product [Symbiodinium sp. CCMP2592]|nr:unnamed protein product [Symbiodinium sp. CCMP2592]